MLDAALRIAAQGTPVFVCGADKAPRTPGGFKDASTNPDIIRAWRSAWEQDGAMIGAAITDGLIVVDIDPRNGGDETMALFPQLHGTRKVRTRSGGMHVYYRVPEEIELRATLGPGVDIKRAGKGYVIVPPSDGYTYVKGGEAAPAPDWLLEELMVDPSQRSSEAHDAKYGRFERGTAYGQAALQRNVGRLAMAVPGERNNALNRAAFSVGQLEAGGELDGDAAVQVLAEAAARAGLEDEEIEKTIESGRSAGAQNPWQAPEEGASKPDRAGATAYTQARAAEAAPSSVSEEGFWMDWEQEEPDLPFFAWPMLPKHAYVLVYGATEASKSMAWVLLLAEASRRGIRSSVYSLENPPATDRKRVSRMRPDPAHFRLTNQHLDFNDGRQLDGLVERESDWGDGRGTDVIMIDTYSHAFHSYSDDGNAKAIAFAQRARHVMQEVGCSIVCIDHTGYMQQDEPRDASAKRQQVDVAVLMKKASVWVPGQPARFTMDNKKAARFANPFFLTGEIRDGKDNGLELGWIGDGPRWDA